MSDLLRLLFLVPLAYLAAVLAAALVVVAGYFGTPTSYQYSDFEYAFWVSAAGFIAMVRIGAVTFLPALGAIVLAEAFRWRSVFYYLAVGGVIGLLAHTMSSDPESFAYRRLLFPAAGFVGAFVYWLIAGRVAGGVPPPVGEAKAIDRTPG